MLLQGRQSTKIALHTPGVVIADATRIHLNQFVFADKSSAKIVFTFQNVPEALRGALSMQTLLYLVVNFIFPMQQIRMTLLSV